MGTMPKSPLADHRGGLFKFLPAQLKLSRGQMQPAAGAHVASKGVALECCNNLLDIPSACCQVFFAATGVSDGDLLRGVRYFSGGASTNSIVMRASSGTGAC